MLFALALATSAHAFTIGTDYKLGVGGATGDTFLALNGKYWLTSRFGVDGYLGTSFVRQRLRLNTELDVLEVSRIQSTSLEFYALVGADVGIGTAYGVQPDIGIGGGVGLAARFAKFPGELFVDAGAGWYPVCAVYFGAYFCDVQPRADLGFRYYVF